MHFSVLHLLLLVGFIVKGSFASYSNGKSRFQEFRGCNDSTSFAVVTQDDSRTEPESTNPNTYPTSTIYPQNNYFQPVIMGPQQESSFRNRIGAVDYNQLTVPYNGAGNELKEDRRVPLLSPGSSRLAQFRQSVMAYRNQITGNRFFEMDGSVRFLLFTRKNPSNGQKLRLHSRDSVEESDFDANKTTKLIIHGFSDIGALGEWVTNLRDAYLSTCESNVIIADFSTFETFLLFWTNLPVFASRRIADLVTFLELTTGTSRENFHIIARAWGTHVAGVTGRLLQGRVGRITGLEPEPRVYGSVLPDYKLLRTDAQFVDVVRVNGRRYFFHGARFGLDQPAGHVDIYPNFSEKTNGCPGTSSNQGIYNFAYCQRGRGVLYFTESVKYPQSHPMCQCPSYADYKAGNCRCTKENSNFYMGEYLSNETRGVFQLTNPTLSTNWFRGLRLFG